MRFEVQSRARAGITGNPGPHKIDQPDRLSVTVLSWIFRRVGDQPGHGVCERLPVDAGEIRRVLKPGGVSLHMFPSRWRPLEPHVFVPLGTIIQNRVWLAVWALLGVRRKWQKGSGWLEVSRSSAEYLNSATNYLSGQAIFSHFGEHFSEVRYADSWFLTHSPNMRGRSLYQLSSRLPFVLSLYRAGWSRINLAK